MRHQQEEKLHRQEIMERFENVDSIGDFSAGVDYALRDSIRIDIPKNEPESGEELEGFVYYQIPEEYALHGGSFPEEVQRYTYSLCKEEGVRYALVLAMIEQESGYKQGCIGDNGESLGYMQVMQKWHEERMKRLGVTDLLNASQNICVGVDYIKELLDRYGTIQDALTAYNYGEAGARKYLWNKGIHLYEYNQKIMERMKEIEEELGQ